MPELIGSGFGDFSTFQVTNPMLIIIGLFGRLIVHPRECVWGYDAFLFELIFLILQYSLSQLRQYIGSVGIKLLNRIRENTQIKGNTFLGVFIYIISVKKCARSPPNLRFRLSKNTNGGLKNEKNQYAGLLSALHI